MCIHGMENKFYISDLGKRLTSASSARQYHSKWFQMMKLFRCCLAGCHISLSLSLASAHYCVLLFMFSIARKIEKLSLSVDDHHHHLNYFLPATVRKKQHTKNPLSLSLTHSNSLRCHYESCSPREASVECRDY
jgi:hypothetical protein